MKKVIFIAIIVLSVLWGCSKKESFSTYISTKKIIGKAVVKNYPNSRYPKTIFGFKSYNMIRKNYLFPIPEDMRAYGLKAGDTVNVLEHVKFGIQSNRYNFYLLEKRGKYVYVNGRCIE
ncbi:MAG: hypothetical protein GWP03_03855 [Proteobacteria bacterium]|nr:hypothetical protein [Pseudomonadota bacterium]